VLFRRCAPVGWPQHRNQQLHITTFHEREPLYRPHDSVDGNIKLTKVKQQRPYNNPGSGYLQNGASGGLPPTGAAPLLPNQGRVLQTGPLRVLCIADVRGQ
jgi:hypothetical protein